MVLRAGLPLPAPVDAFVKPYYIRPHVLQRPTPRSHPMQLSDHACRNHVRVASLGTVRTLLVIGALSVGLGAPALAQNVLAPAPAASASADAEDPVSRFLSEKGLMPSTKPVVEMAQQVRSKASDMASSLVTSAPPPVKAKKAKAS